MAMKRSPQSSPEPAQHLPLTGFYRLYAANLKAERKSAQTTTTYTYVLAKFADWFAAEHGRAAQLGDFTSTTVCLFLGAIQDKTKWAGHPTLADHGTGSVAGAAVHLYTRTLKTFAAWLAREEHVPVHPLLNLRLPKVEQKQLQPLSEEEERQLLSAYDDNKAADCRIKAIFLLMLDTGLRRAEVIGLKEVNIDLDQGFLLVMGKGRKERTAPFGFTTEKVLRKYVSFSRPEPAHPQVDTFFRSPDGYPLTAVAIKQLFDRARKRTGIARLHPHLLRHTYGVRAQAADMPTITLQHYMGHASSRTTERYAHAGQSEKLKRARGYSPIDRLGVRVKHVGQAGRRKTG